jgi:hypothetical protein
LIYDSSVVISGSGFGSIPRVLTMQQHGQDGLESGCVGNDGSGFGIGDAFCIGDALVDAANGIANVGGDEPTPLGFDGNKFAIPTLASLGITTAGQIGLVFNPSDPANPTQTLVVGRASANYEIFSLRKFSELSRTKADLASAEAGELEQRFNAALETESSYYDVLVNQELSRVNRERTRRAREGLGVARARVASGAAVQTDSLQLVLELVRAQVDSLRQHNALRKAQLELGRLRFQARQDLQYEL